MAEYVITFCKHLNLDVPTNASRDEKIQALFAAFGGPQGVFDCFISGLSILEDLTPDAKLIE